MSLKLCGKQQNQEGIFWFKDFSYHIFLFFYKSISKCIQPIRQKFNKNLLLILPWTKFSSNLFKNFRSLNTVHNICREPVLALRRGCGCSGCSNHKNAATVAEDICSKHLVISQFITCIHVKVIYTLTKTFFLNLA